MRSPHELELQERQGRLRHVLACDERKLANRHQREAALAAARAQQLRNEKAAAEDISNAEILTHIPDARMGCSSRPRRPALSGAARAGMSPEASTVLRPCANG